MEEESLTSRIFVMGRREFGRQLLLLHGMPWVAAFLLALIPVLLLGIFHDLRWIIVFFMLICLVLPMLTFFLYFYHGMRASTVTNIVPHSLRIDDEGITVTLFDLSEDEDGVTRHNFRSERQFPFRLFKRYITGYSCVILPLKSPEKGFLWLPLSAFADNDEFIHAVKTIGEGIKRNNGINQTE